MISFEISRELILRPVSYLVAIVELKNVDDINSCIGFKVSWSSIELMATCTESSLRYRIEHQQSEDVECTFAVNARVFSEIVKKLPPGSALSCEVTERTLVIHSGFSVFSLATTDFEAFPMIEHQDSVGSFSIQANKFLKLIDRSKLFISDEEIRYSITGLAIDCDEKGNCISCVATDGSRLAVAKSNKCECLYQEHVIIPKKSIAELSKLLAGCSNEEAQVDISATSLKFSIGNYELISKLIDARFPNYKSIIPTGHSAYFECNSKDFISTLERVSSVHHEKLRNVKLILKGNKLSVKSYQSIHGLASEDLEIDKCEGEIEISFNVKYLFDAIVNIPERFCFLFKGKSEPTMLKDISNSSFFYVIMPIKC